MLTSRTSCAYTYRHFRAAILAYNGETAVQIGSWLWSIPLTTVRS